MNNSDGFARLEVNSRGTAALAQLRERVAGRHVVLLDYPLYYNIGDLLIFLGLLSMLEDCGAEIALAQTLHSHSPAKVGRALREDSVILFHGGGNFGDLYPRLHGTRLEIFRQYSEREMVVLPQTIFFRDPGALEETRKAAENCRDLTIYVRDHESVDAARAICSKVEMAPDTAHYLAPVCKPAKNGETLLFRRRDFEATASEKGFDWDEIIHGPDRLLCTSLKAAAKAASLVPGTVADEAVLSAWKRQCETLLERASAKFAAFERIDADRLHAVILATIMGMPMKTGDTRFGKLSRYREAWLEAV